MIGEKELYNSQILGKMIVAMGIIKTGLAWINGNSTKHQIDRGIILVRIGTRQYLRHKKKLR